MPHQVTHVMAARTRRDIHGRAVAGLAGDPDHPIGAHPVARENELRQRVRQLGDQRGPRRGGQVVQHQHRFPDRGQMAVAFDDAVP